LRRPQVGKVKKMKYFPKFGHNHAARGSSAKAPTPPRAQTTALAADHRPAH